MKYLSLLFIFFMPFMSMLSQDGKALDETLVQMLEEEQAVRKSMSTFYAEWSGKEEFQSKRDSIVAAMLKIDKANQQFIANLLDSVGWPGNLTPQANMAIFMIVQHSPVAYMNKYAPLITEGYRKGYVDSGLYAIFEDRYFMRQNKPQLYGSQIMNGYVWPIQDLDLLDARRKEMNLSSHQEYLDSFKKSGMQINWNKELTVEELIKILGFSPKDVE